MNKNWYAVYTKPQCEKKVATQLTKKKIENFCPLNRRFLSNQNGRKKILLEPLFPSFVFVNINEVEMFVVKQTADVINFIYWLGKPAVIKTAEIENLDIIVNTYFNLKLEKTVVNTSGTVRIIKESSSVIDSDSNSSTNIKIILPSLGYILVTQTEKIMVEPYRYGLQDTNLLI